MVAKERPPGWNGRLIRRVGTGDKVRVHLNVRSYAPLGNVILQDPLPAGFEVVPESATGSFDREERRDDRQVFFFASVSNAVQVSYVIQAIHPGPKTSQPHPQHNIYPYLLRNLNIDHANQVWASDVTYIPMENGFIYLTVIMDWFSRKVLSWRLSNSLEGSFCVDALEEGSTAMGHL